MRSSGRHPLLVITLVVLGTLLLISSSAAAPAKPNFLIILADDMGFSDAGCYGGEIATPNLDKLASNGIRFTQCYNAARCWPSRSSLLTGYYPQQIRMDPPKGRLPVWARLLPHYLGPIGYRSYHIGKWHIKGAPKPVADGGFDHSYWFEDWDRYFSPAAHYEDDKQLPKVKPDSGYYATTEFANRAIGYLKQHAAEHADQPFFCYLAFISPHFPLHALPDDIARYRDRYLQGWDDLREQRWKRLRAMEMVTNALPPLEPDLSPRYLSSQTLAKLGPGEVAHAVPWNTLTDEQKRFQATKMAIHAAMVDRMDREIGRVIDQVRAMGALDNTVILFLSDNGADATLLVRGEGHDPAAPPGSWKSFLCIGPGWASASNAPFRRHKIWVHEGGISTPLIVNWPAGLKKHNELRHAMVHITDVVPTVLELAGVTAGISSRETTTETAGTTPTLPGRSLVTLFDRDAPDTSRTLFFHHEGNRAIRTGDWKLVSAREDKDEWALYNIRKDRGESSDLATSDPVTARGLEAHWKQLEALFRQQAGAETGR